MSNHITVVAQRNGETMQLNVEPTDTVLSVKEQIHARWRFDVQRQKLNIDGLTPPWLDNEATLAEYNIANVDAGKRRTVNTITLHVAGDGSACASAGASFTVGAGAGANFGGNDIIDTNSSVVAGEGVGNGAVKAPIETAKARPLSNIALRSPRGNGHHGRDTKKRRMDSLSCDSGGGSSSESEKTSGWRGAAHATIPLLPRRVPRVVVGHKQRPDLLVFKNRSDLRTNNVAGNIMTLFYAEQDGNLKYFEFDLQRPKTSAGSNPVVQCDICLDVLDTDAGYRTFSPPTAATGEPPFKLVTKDTLEPFEKVQDDGGRWSYRIELKEEITTVKARIQHVSSKNDGVPYRLRFAHMDGCGTPEFTMPIFVGSKMTKRSRSASPRSPSPQLPSLPLPLIQPVPQEPATVAAAATSVSASALSPTSRPHLHNARQPDLFSPGTTDHLCKVLCCPDPPVAPASAFAPAPAAALTSAATSAPALTPALALAPASATASSSKLAFDRIKLAIETELKSGHLAGHHLELASVALAQLNEEGQQQPPGLRMQSI